MEIYEQQISHNASWLKAQGSLFASRALSCFRQFQILSNRYAARKVSRWGTSKSNISTSFWLSPSRRCAWDYKSYSRPVYWPVLWYRLSKYFKCWVKLLKTNAIYIYNPLFWIIKWQYQAGWETKLIEYFGKNCKIYTLTNWHLQFFFQILQHYRVILKYTRSAHSNSKWDWNLSWKANLNKLYSKPLVIYL